MHAITERLWVGNVYEAERPPAKVAALLFVAEEFSADPPSGLAYQYIPFKEYGPPDVSLLDRAVTWLEQQSADNVVMVCCRAGMGRSVSVVMAYLCCTERLTYDDVLQLAISRRPGALPLPDLRSAIEKVQTIRQTRMRTVLP
ncbi:hypothetical protein W02_30280 [Nitrospira sp. KM1]|uniref:dual specificity protein phosphatase family protein n=1 Tax=Nitrospira sp. KM1 TaxID=1936990 RepID=UPI0013A791AA|nr:dual specificity protein phosphatase [Nitrospira sp. KM1]BCA55888.1 hypothetical protein W02_30280 [Nitrospira sp. KM1]